MSCECDPSDEMTITETIHTIARAIASGASASKIFLYRVILWPPDLPGKQYGDRIRRLVSPAYIRVIVLTNDATRVYANVRQRYGERHEHDRTQAMHRRGFRSAGARLQRRGHARVVRLREDNVARLNRCDDWLHVSSRHGPQTNRYSAFRLDAIPV